MTLTVDDFLNALPRSRGRMRSPPVHPVWARSILDPGAPQYVLPEFALVDICANLFRLDDGNPIPSRSQVARSFADTILSSLPSGAMDPDLTLHGVTLREFVQTFADIVRAPERKGKALPHYPIAPEFAYYAGIRANDPNLLASQLIPAIIAGGDSSLTVLEEFRWALGASHPPAGKSRRPDDLLETVFGLILKTDGKRPVVPAPLNPAVNVLSPGGTLTDQTFLKWFRPHSGDRPRTPAERLVLDLRRLNAYEQQLPRLEWVKWVCAFMRVYLALTCLWRSRAVTLVFAECDKVLRGQSTERLSKDALHDGLLGLRPDDVPLLRARSEWTSQINIAVQTYAEARIGVNSILWILSAVDGLAATSPSDLENFQDARILSEISTTPKVLRGLLSMPYDRSGWECDAFLDLVAQRMDILDALAIRFGCTNARDLVRSIIDAFPKYTSVSKATWANNLREYVVYSLNPPRMDSSKDEFSLIRTWGGKYVTGGVKVVPAPGLLTLLVQLVATEAREEQVRPTLLDLTRLFQELRVKFEPGAEGLDMLISNLGKLGLLEGSPDAMLAAPLGAPYSHL